MSSNPIHQPAGSAANNPLYPPVDADQLSSGAIEVNPLYEGAGSDMSNPLFGP